ncbi:MAG TPA: XRE family transcriptional regulator [Rhizobiales bacterium]|nr:XRE family transcriptional regulator [Hyphomicrobiales bacterium]
MTKKTPHPVDVHVGSRVKFRRVVQGMSQEQLGSTLGLTFQQVQKYEKGTNRISASRLWDIGDALGVKVSFFFEGLRDLDVSAGGFADAGQAHFNRQVNSTEGLKLNRYFTQIEDPQIRKKILELVKTLSLAGKES